MNASCPLFIKTTGTHIWSRTGDCFIIAWTDSLGQSDSMVARLVGSRITASGRLDGTPYSFSGTMAPGGTTYTGTTSTGCAVTARRG